MGDQQDRLDSLEAAIEEIVDERNERITAAPFDAEGESFEAELDSYNEGPAIDVWKNGESVFSLHHLMEAAHDHGFIISNVKRVDTSVFPDGGESKTRIFLREADERFDDSAEQGVYEPELDDYDAHSLLRILNDDEMPMDYQVAAQQALEAVGREVEQEYTLAE